MLINFFLGLKQAGLPVSTKEFLVLVEAMAKRLVLGSVTDFFYLARLCLVKDEKLFDRFDQAFSAYFQTVQSFDEFVEALVPEDWLKAEFHKHLTEDDKRKIERLGGLEHLLEEHKKRHEEKQNRHTGGSKWIGTGGTSPFGNNGYHPEGIRIGGIGKNGGAVKVWDQRNYRNLDDSVEIGTRNIKVALKRLRKFARTGADEELDLDDTIRSTARNAGWLDLKMVPERRNTVKVLIFFDVGGSMYPYVRVCEELFSASRTEFKTLQYFYFHNFLYDFVWEDNRRRDSEMTPTWDIIHKFPVDYKIIFVGDAAMAPYEIVSPGGNIEYINKEPGETWIRRMTSVYPKLIWLNPTPQSYWDYTQSIGMVRTLIDDRMFPLTLNGLDRGMRYLSS